MYKKCITKNWILIWFDTFFQEIVADSVHQNNLNE